MIDVSKIKAVIFDMDGLMFNTEDIYRAAVIQIGEKRGKVFTDEIHQQMMGRAAVEDIKVLLNAWGLNEDPVKVFSERQDIYLKLVDSMIKPELGLLELLNVLREKKVIIGLATGSAKRIIDKNLSIFNLQSYFSFIISGEQIKNGKPNPEIYNLAVKKTGFDAKNVLVLEDSVNGVNSGKQAGCIVFAVPNRYSKDQDYTAADQIFNNLEEIADKYKGL